MNFIICSHYNESFLSKGKYENHYNKKHQNQIQFDKKITVSRTENGKFICLCEKDFEFENFLKCHYQNCIKVHENELKNYNDKIVFFFNFINK